MNKLAAYSIIAVWWTLLLGFGVVCALALPLNLMLVPFWLMCAGSVGRLSEELLDKARPAARERTASPLFERSIDQLNTQSVHNA